MNELYYKLGQAAAFRDAGFDKLAAAIEEEVEAKTEEKEPKAEKKAPKKEAPPQEAPVEEASMPPEAAPEEPGISEEELLMLLEQLPPEEREEFVAQLQAALAESGMA